MIHGSISITKHIGGRLIADAGAEGNANAGAAEHLVTAEMERFFEQAQDAFRHNQCRLWFAQIFEEHGELVAAETRQGIAGAQAAFEASRKSDEQLIANQVSETVVNQFETIEIEEQHGERW